MSKHRSGSDLLLAFRSMSRVIGAHLQTASFKYKRVLALVIESGMILPSALAIEIAIYFANNNGAIIAYQALAQFTASITRL